MSGFHAAITRKFPFSSPLSDSNAIPMCDLVHELCQPLSEIDAIACYFEMTLRPEMEHLRKLALRLQELVEESDVILSRAARSGEPLSRAGAQT
ncbi:MAG TPA: hypothetical protein VN610_00075 [Bryobacteraceae bacterium]|nr:hypothetical protein [Bryobacteraceae bacterium]